MTTPDWWATYSYSREQGKFLLQGWEVQDGALTKVAETDVPPLFHNTGSSQLWELIEHPDGGIAFVGLPGIERNKSTDIVVSRFGMFDGGFTQLDTYSVPTPDPGFDLMDCTKDYAFFVTQAFATSTTAPYEIRSLRDLSLIDSGTHVKNRVGGNASLSPYFTVGNTFFFRDNTASNTFQGLHVAEGDLSVVTPASNSLNQDRFTNRWMPHYPSRDRWAAFKNNIGGNDFNWQYNLTLADEAGNVVDVTFPVLDPSTYRIFKFGRYYPIGIAVQELFFAAQSNGSTICTWRGFADKQLPSGYYEPHGFTGQFTIPANASGLTSVTTPWADLGIVGTLSPGSTVYYDPSPLADTGSSLGGNATGSTAMLLFSADSAYDNYDRDLYSLLAVRPDGTYNRLQQVDSGYYPVGGWGGFALSTLSLAPRPPLVPAIDAGLLAAGQRFAKGRY